METLAFTVPRSCLNNTQTFSKNKESSNLQPNNCYQQQRMDYFQNVSVSKQGEKKKIGLKTRCSFQPIYARLSLLKSAAAPFEESWWEIRPSPDSVL